MQKVFYWSYSNYGVYIQSLACTGSAFGQFVLLNNGALNLFMNYLTMCIVSADMFFFKNGSCYCIFANFV